MIDAMMQDSINSTIADELKRPNPYQPPEVKFGVSQLLKAPFQGAASGSTKSAAFAADVLGAFGDVAGAGGFNQGGMFSTPTPEERKQQEAARAKWIDSGPQFSNPVGDELRQRAKDVMPDPTQTHAAAQIVAGVSEFATQAVTYAAGAGPLAPLLLGADVGLAESDKLKKEGVDLATRSKVGAVAGVTAAVSVALPVVGKTVAQTAGLVAVGGPGGFMAQNAASKAILENADYSKPAAAYDPLEPVGLVLSALVPAAFGGAALRARAKAAPTLKEVVLGIESNGQRYAKDGSVLTSPKGAKGEMQVMDGTNLDPGFGVRPAADNSLAERARVGSDYLDAMLKRYGSEDKAMAAYNAGPGALDAALAKGGDWLGRMPAETQAYVKKGMKKLGEGRTAEAARATIARDPEAVAAARVQQTATAVDSYRLTPDTDVAGMTRHQDAVETAHEQMARGEPVSVSDLLASPAARAAEFDQWIQTSKVRGEDGSPLVMYRGSPNENAAANGPTFLSTSGEFASNYAREGAVYPMVVKAERPFDASRGDGLRLWSQYLKETGQDFYAAGKTERGALPNWQQEPKLREWLAAKGIEHDGIWFAESNGTASLAVPSRSQLRSAISGLAADHPFSDWQKHINTAIAEMRAAMDPPPADPPAPKATGKQMLTAAGESTIKPAPKAGAEGAGSPDAAALDAQTAAVDPDLMVQLEGMDKPMRVSELLEQVKKEAADETRDASLVEVAANCFLRG